MPVGQYHSNVARENRLYRYPQVGKRVRDVGDLIDAG
jgi:hypothetical protein